MKKRSPKPRAYRTAILLVGLRPLEDYPHRIETTILYTPKRRRYKVDGLFIADDALMPHLLRTGKLLVRDEYALPWEGRYRDEMVCRALSRGLLRHAEIK